MMLPAFLLLYASSYSSKQELFTAKQELFTAKFTAIFFSATW